MRERRVLLVKLNDSDENRSVTNCICYDVWISVKLDAMWGWERRSERKREKKIWKKDDMGRPEVVKLRCEIASQSSLPC